MVIYHTERALPDVTRAYDPTADQKIIGSGNEDGAFVVHILFKTRPRQEQLKLPFQS